MARTKPNSSSRGNCFPRAERGICRREPPSLTRLPRSSHVPTAASPAVWHLAPCQALGSSPPRACGSSSARSPIPEGQSLHGACRQPVPGQLRLCIKKPQAEAVSGKQTFCSLPLASQFPWLARLLIARRGWRGCQIV